ncbi:MAG TPA: cation-transporting P-type ATPase [Candidatus Babeliales bacterium]|nr:cation-transporting P-type ATPase [Candidatus Babeliales bacterium]
MNEAPPFLFTFYATTPLDQLLKKLETSIDTGLRTSQIKQRQQQYGPNYIQEHDRNALHIILAQLKSPFFYLLAIVAIIALAVQEWYDGIVILLFITINVVVGFYQEYHAENQLSLLKKYLVHRERVIRDGKELEITSEQMVPGDIVLLFPGDRVPADIRLIMAENVQVDESVLTGESLPVSKRAENLKGPINQPTQAENILFTGTLITSGKAVGVVFAIGSSTQMGALVYLTIATMRESSFAKKVGRLGNIIIILVFTTLICVFGANVLLKAGRVNIFDLFIFSLALAITVIPEALPVVVTFSLSQGISRLAKKKVIVKRLSAIEDLGSVQLICTDKTGTLTQNSLTIAGSYARDEKRLLWSALLAAENTYDAIPKATKGFDRVLWDAVAQETKKLSEYKKIGEIPFDPQTKRNLVVVQHGTDTEIIERGMVDEIVSHCATPDKEWLKSFLEWSENEGRLGRRVLAVAIRTVQKDRAPLKSIQDNENNFELLGGISFADPIKTTAHEAIDKAQKLGIQIKVLSGDIKEVVGAVCKQIGLITDATEVLTGAELINKSADEKQALCFKYNAFARVLPDQKLEIIKILQTRYEVGYMGDGINDGPALKIADVSVAVEDAVDSARDAADVILLKKSLLVIVNGVEEGRIIFANTFKYIKTALSTNFGNFYSLAIATLLIDYLPMLPMQLLILNVMSDLPMIAISTDAVDPKQIRKPVSYQTGDILAPIVILSIVSTIFDLIYFSIFRRYEPVVLQTGWFCLSILTELVFIFSIRTEGPFFRAHRPSSTLVALALLSGTAAVALPFIPFTRRLFSFTKLEPHHLLIIAILCIIYFITTDIVKCAYYWKRSNGNKVITK